MKMFVILAKGQENLCKTLYTFRNKEHAQPKDYL
jgi:hypothetical protein